MPLAVAPGGAVMGEYDICTCGCCGYIKVELNVVAPVPPPLCNAFASDCCCDWGCCCIIDARFSAWACPVVGFDLLEFLVICCFELDWGGYIPFGGL